MPATFLSKAPKVQPQPSDDRDVFVDADGLRAAFALAMSNMYKAEVPLYGDLVRIVQKVNEEVQSRLPHTTDANIYDSPHRLSLERHGAIRLGTPEELHTVRRIFGLLGMHPVGYYDLAVAGLPMHATCFRPITSQALSANPFRVFTTLLRPQLLGSSKARDLAMRLLEQRQIFSEALLELLDTVETHQHGRLKSSQGELLVNEAVRSFSWQPVAAATHEEYATLTAEHPILADIPCFRSAHINHLTPRALDIGMAQKLMVEEGLSVKDRIEGPPLRNCPILLRQTSFLALEEAIQFPMSDSPSSDTRQWRRLVQGHHKARFGEIEERGAAVTARGRELYDQLLEESMEKASSSRSNQKPLDLDETMAKTFEQKFPDDWNELRRQRLIYCEYRCEPGSKDRLAALGISRPKATPSLLDKLICEGVLTMRPITYEDFLPFSAAGIFRSNLQSSGDNKASSPLTASQYGKASEDRAGYQAAMGCSLLDADQLYAESQIRSLERCATELGLFVENVSTLL